MINLWPLRQDFGWSHLLPVARQRLEEGFSDDSELYEGELQNAVNSLRAS